MSPRTKLQIKKPGAAAPAQQEPAPVEATATEPVTVRAKSPDRPDRAGKKMLAVYLPESAWLEFRTLCLAERRTGQELLEEAVADLFAKYRRS